jgi:transcriptional regulator with XRE-family HTH domain
MSFGSAVRRLRLARGYSQEEFADHVGIHRTYIGDVELGKRNIGLINVTRIAKALDVRVADLMADLDT